MNLRAIVVSMGSRVRGNDVFNSTLSGGISYMNRNKLNAIDNDSHLQMQDV